MQRIANPSTPVRFRLSPPQFPPAGWQSVYAVRSAILMQAGSNPRPRLQTWTVSNSSQFETPARVVK